MKFRICASEIGSSQSPRLNTSASLSQPYCADIAIKHRNFAGKLWLGGAALLAASLAQSAAFTPGNLAVLRVGDGAATLTSACTAIFVDEYSTSGSLVQSIALPTADAGANNAICLSGTATSEGFMSRTVDGQALVVAGYDAVPGTLAIATAASINRVVAIIAADGTVNTSNSFIDGFTLSNVRSAAANSASAIYMGGTGGSASGGTRLLSTTGAFTTTTQISTSVTNTRAVGIFAGQLFTSTGSAPFRLASVGTGLPTTAGQTTTNLPGFATATTSPFQFVFADLDAGVAGLDTLWVANDDATALQKHSFNGTTWAALNSIGVAADAYRGLTRIGTTLYATGRSSGVGVIRSLPSGGFNAALSGVPSLLATATANRVFQGIAATPEAAVMLPVLSITSASIAEANVLGTDTNLSFALNLTTPAPAGGVSGTFSTSDGSSGSPANFAGTSNAGGNDYAAQTNVAFNIAAGSTSGTITVPVRGDVTFEFSESFDVTLNTAGLTGATLGTSTAVGTITNDDASPTVLANSPSVTEGTGLGVTTMTFNLSLDGPTQRDCNFGYESFVNANAQGGGVDFDDVPNNLVNLSGANQTAVVNVSIIRDALVEPNETFELDIFGEPFDCNLPTGNPVGTIIDDDSAAATVSINDITQAEGNSGTTTMTFTVTRTSAGTAQTVTAEVLPTIFAGSLNATPGSDYTLPTPNPQTLSFAIGELSKTIQIAIIGERIWEQSERIGIRLSSPTNGLVISDDFGFGIISNDDIPVINVSNASVTEGDGPGTTAMSFTLTAVDPSTAPPRAPEQINGGFAGQITINYRTANGSAISSSDYIAADSTVILAPEFRSTNVTIQIVGDTTAEPTEQFTLETYNNVSFTSGTSGTGTILDTDAAAAATVSIASETVTETASNFVRNFTITRSNNLTAFTVLVSSASISATLSTDYDPGAPQVITFTAGGALTSTIPVTIVGDNLVESTETFELNLSALNNTTGTTTISNAVATGTILDDDTLIAIANEALNEGNSGLTPMVFTLTRTGITDVPHSVTLRSVDSSAMVSNNDYQAIDQIVTFAIGETSKQVSVNVVGDRFWESEEFFRMNLSSPSANVQIGPQGFGGIRPDDQPKINVSDVTLLEGNNGTVNAVFTVTASDDLMPPIRSNALVPNGSNTFIEIDFATAPGSATSGTDYTATNGFLNFDLNDRSKTITVPVIGDTSVEMDETFLVNLSLRAGSNPVRFDDGVGQGTIQNDDATATTITLAASPSALTYGQATTLTATVTCGSTPTGSVTFSNGASSLGSGALIAGSAAGTGIATLNLPLLDVASYSVIANYAGVGPCNGATSSASTIVVNPAATSLSLSGPARSRINQPIAFSGALNILAPGAGTPNGTVTLTSSGSSSCSYSSPSATSCNLSWNSFGSKTITASFAPSTGNYLASFSNSASTFVFALADLDVSLTNQVNSYQANGVLVYTLTLNNRGPDFAPGVRLRSQLPAGLFKVRWTCTAVAGAICPEAGGVSDINALVQTLPANGQLIYTLSGVVVSPAPLVIRATAAVTLPDDGTIEDPVLTNQSATDTDAIDGILRDGFEDQ